MDVALLQHLAITDTLTKVLWSHSLNFFCPFAPSSSLLCVLKPFSNLFFVFLVSLSSINFSSRTMLQYAALLALRTKVVAIPLFTTNVLQLCRNSLYAKSKSYREIKEKECEHRNLHWKNFNRNQTRSWHNGSIS